jgi:hypothetical protein
MRRAILGSAVALCAAGLLATDAGAPPQVVNLVNGIGLIDYTRKPDFKVGDWVRYHITARSVLGARDDYMVTVVIAGEETFWGEDGFWVESWTEPIDRAPQAIATFMSFAVFGDTLPLPHMTLYQRKSISEVTEDGRPVETLARRPPGSLKARSPIDDQVHWSIDTLGVDTVSVPTGLYQCAKVLTRQGKGAKTDVGDSTLYTEVHDERVTYISRQVPITSLVREDIDYWFQRRTWQIGRSQEAAPMHMMEHSTGTARLVGFGSGMVPRLVPPEKQKMVRAQQAGAPPKPARGPVPAKRAPPRGSG